MIPRSATTGTAHWDGFAPSPAVGAPESRDKNAVPHFSAGGEAVDGDGVIALARFQLGSWEIRMIR
jgi:hypothetical protein